MRRLIAFALMTVVMLAAAPLSAHDLFRVIGTVTKVQADKVDVKTKDGGIISVWMDETTRVWKENDKKTTDKDLKTGLSVIVDAYGDSVDDLLAADVRIVPPISRAPAK
jgi:hypothetical protein